MLRTSLFTRLFSRDVFQANHARRDDEPESRAQSQVTAPFCMLLHQQLQ